MLDAADLATALLHHGTDSAAGIETALGPTSSPGRPPRWASRRTGTEMASPEVDQPSSPSGSRRKVWRYSDGEVVIARVKWCR